MNRQRFTLLALQVLLLNLLLSGCTAPTTTFTPVPTAATPSPSTPSPSATATFTPEPTPTISPTPGVFDMTINPYAGPPSPDHLGRLGRGAIWDIQFRMDGTTLSVFSGTGIWLYDAQTLGTIAAPEGEQPFSIQSDEPILGSPDGKYLATISNINREYAVRLHDAASGEPVHTLEGGSGGRVVCAAWSPDGRQIASGTVVNRIFVWETASGRWDTRLDVDQGTYGLAFSPDGETLASVHADGSIMVWDIANGLLLQTLPGPGMIGKLLAWSPDGRTLASSYPDGTVVFWDTSDWKTLLTLTNVSMYTNALAWSPDSRTLATRDDNVLSLWEAASGDKLRDVEITAGKHLNLLWSPDGSRLVDRTAEGNINIWDAATGQSVGQIMGHMAAVDMLAWSPQGSPLASAIQDTGLILWDTTTWQPQQILWQDKIGALNDLAWSPDGVTLAGGFETAPLRLWNATTGEQRNLDMVSFSTTSLDWSPDGSRLASGMKDTSVMIWEPTTGEPVSTMLGHSGRINDVAFSPDGSLLASSAKSSDSLNLEIILWDPATSQELRTIRKDVKDSDNEARLAWSADGSTLAAYLDEGATVVVFEAATGNELPTSGNLQGTSVQVAYSPDNQFVAEGTDSGLIYLSYNLEQPVTSIPIASPSPPAAPDLKITPTAMPTIGPGSVRVSTGDMRPVIFIPGGLFRMGASEDDPSADPDEKPQHDVSLDAFWVDQFEVTHEEYSRCVQAEVCNLPNELDNNGFAYSYAAAFSDAPVVNVSWDDAAAYCTWAGKRLPTEAEWEKAARGTDARIYPWGNDPEAHTKAWFCEQCIYDPNYPDVQDDFSRPVTAGSFPEGISPYGVYDMAGNVWEWVFDWYASDTYSQPSPVNPRGPESGNLHVVRGGSWTTASHSLRTTYREARSPGSSWIDVGFRCVMEDDRSKLSAEMMHP